MAFSNSFPIVTKRKDIKMAQPKWLTIDLREACKMKNVLYKKFINDKTQTSELQYKTYRNLLTKCLRSARRSHIFDSIYKVKNDTKKLWRILNEIANRSPNLHPVGPLKDSNMSTITDKLKIANMLNSYFATIGKNNSNSAIVNNDTWKHFLTADYQDTMFISPVTPDEVGTAFKTCKKSSAIDIDGLNYQVVEIIINIIKTPLSFIFNLSFQAGFFPTLMKKAKVIPLFKGGNAQLCTNYRPISILPFLSKLLEKLF